MDLEQELSKTTVDTDSLRRIATRLEREKESLESLYHQTGNQDLSMEANK